MTLHLLLATISLLTPIFCGFVIGSKAGGVGFIICLAIGLISGVGSFYGFVLTVDYFFGRAEKSKSEFQQAIVVGASYIGAFVCVNVANCVVVQIMKWVVLHI